MIKQILIVLAAALVLSTPAKANWWSGSTGSASDQEVAQGLEALVSQGNRVVGMPSIVNFFERRMARMIYEMRDNPEYATYAYWTTYEGRYVYVCDSIGYGLNASVQFASPSKLVPDIDLGQHRGSMELPQAEPNALYMPEGLAATYILCAFDPNVGPDPDNPNPRPVYAEQNMFVSPFRIPNAINPYE